jgi:excisionase family DNA binding protein
MNYLNAEALAERLNTSVRSARRIMAERRVETTKIGRLIRVSESALEKYLAKNTQPAISDRGEVRGEGRHRRGIARA